MPPKRRRRRRKKQEAAGGGGGSYGMAGGGGLPAGLAGAPGSDPEMAAMMASMLGSDMPPGMMMAMMEGMGMDGPQVGAGMPGMAGFGSMADMAAMMEGMYDFGGMDDMADLGPMPDLASMPGIDGYDELPASADDSSKHTRLYDQLGIAPDASSADIRRAYRAAVRIHHPDKGGDPEKFKQAQEAYETLMDDASRRAYDKYGEQSLDAEFRASFGMEDEVAEADEITDIIVPLRLSLHEQWTGGSKDVEYQRMNARMVQEDCSLSVAYPAGIAPGEYLDFEGKGHALLGGRLRVLIMSQEASDDSDGQRALRLRQDLLVQAPCSMMTALCGGQLRVKLLGGESLLLPVPAGVCAGQLLRFRGLGFADRHGVRPGDLFLQLMPQLPSKALPVEQREALVAAIGGGAAEGEEEEEEAAAADLHPLAAVVVEEELLKDAKADAKRLKEHLAGEEHIAKMKADYIGNMDMPGLGGMGGMPGMPGMGGVPVDPDQCRSM
eukprot:PLAT156.7.p1 GENE.PLAT156.7~~PLAT156.7.p1  ORF type:complete len:495 (-),score=170.09 PLAT156.7:26-1510(-)